MKKQITILSLILLSIFANAQTIIAPDTISTNTVWADTIFLNSNVYIENGVQLMIKPGAVVIANDWYGIDCQGQLLAEGTEQDSIIFTVADTSGFYNIDTVLGGWKGVIFKNTDSSNDSSIFDYCVMEYGKANGYESETKKGGLIYTYFFSKLRVSNSILRNSFAYNDGGAICLMFSSAIIKNNIIDNNISYTEFSGGGGLYIIGTSVAIVTNNVFCNNLSGPLICQYGDCFRQGWGAAIYVNLTGTDINTNRTYIISNKFVNNWGNDIFYDNSLHSIFMNNILFNNKYGCPVFGGGGPYAECLYIGNTIVNNNTNFPLIDIMQNSWCYNNILITNTSINISNNWYLIYTMSGYSYPNDEGDFSKVKNNYCQNKNYIVSGTDTTYVDFNNDGDGNIYGTTPQFVNPTSDTGFVANWQDYDWRLQVTSPCINAGTTDTSGLELPEQDAFGNPRIFGGRVDIGAYENQTEVWNNVFSLENKLELTYYPNPVRNSLQLKINNVQLQKQNLQIFDINGKLVKQIAINNEAITIDVSDLETGVYYLRVGGLSKEFIKY